MPTYPSRIDQMNFPTSPRVDLGRFDTDGILLLKLSILNMSPHIIEMLDTQFQHEVVLKFLVVEILQEKFLFAILKDAQPIVCIHFFKTEILKKTLGKGIVTPRGNKWADFN